MNVGEFNIRWVLKRALRLIFSSDFAVGVTCATTLSTLWKPQGEFVGLFICSVPAAYLFPSLLKSGKVFLDQSLCMDGPLDTVEPAPFI